MPAVAYFLGIDGGGSKTTCVLGDEKGVLGSVTVGGSNPVRFGDRVSRAALQRGVREVCRNSAIKPSQIVAICAGVAGAVQEDIRRQVADILAKLTPAQILVLGDMVIAHQAALATGVGIAVLSGTGSIAYGRDASGRTARAGGWGYAISDEGSGHWIGMQAVVAVTRAVDSGSDTKLRTAILKYWGIRSCDDLVCRANTSPPPDFAGLFPAVLAAAKAGDPYGHDILKRAGLELAGLAQLVYRRLWKAGEHVEVGLAGGVFENSAEVRDSFEEELEKSIPEVRVFLSTTRPAEGALSLARKLTGVAQ
jgi:glucosamine kinase